MSDAPPVTQSPYPSRSRYFWIAFWALLALTAGLRLPGITRPLVGNFATKNVMYAMIARNWVAGRAGILYPTLDCLRGGRRSLHMLEFSVSAYLAGGLWQTFGGSLDVWGRATSVAFSVASVAILVLLVGRWHGPTAALGAGFVLALAPISIIYGQHFMLDASLVFFTVATFYGLERWLAEGRSGWLLGAGVAFALLLLTKIYILVLLLPLARMVLFRDRSAPQSSDRQAPTRTSYVLALAAAGLAVLPAALWCLHALRTAAPGSAHAAHIYSSLQGNAEAYRPPDPLLGSPDFYRQLLDDFTGVILTPLGFVLFLAGFLDKRWRRHAAWLLAMVILVAALPRKFYQMNYYYMALLPPLCVVAGLGWQVTWERLRPGRTATAGLLLVALLLSMRYAVKPALVTPAEDRAVVAAGRAIQALTSEEEPVVTMHGAGIDLLYYSNRPGWAVSPDAPGLETVLEACRRHGARYLVAADAQATPGQPTLLAAYPLVAEGDGFRIYQLRPAAEQAGGDLGPAAE